MGESYTIGVKPLADALVKRAHESGKYSKDITYQLILIAMAERLEKVADNLRDTQITLYDLNETMKGS